MDVAERAGVSRTTASAALGGGGRVGEETRRHVLAVAAAMGYEVNRLAQNLRSQRAGAIAVYLPPDSSDHEYYLAFAFGVVDGATEHETPVVLIPNGTTETSLARDHVDGYIVVDALDDDPQLARILATGKPVIAAEPLPPGSPAPAGLVEIDHRRAVTALLDHLRAQGARRVALIEPTLDTAWARQVDDAYRTWCAAAGVDRWVASTPFLADAAGVQQPVDELFADRTGPDAILVAPDGIAAAVAAAVATKGVEIGRDVLLAACVDGIGVWSSTPPITAIDLRPRAHGRACADLLWRVLEDPDGDAPTGSSPRTVRFEPELRTRASTRAG